MGRNRNALPSGQKYMNSRHNKWIGGLAISVAVATLSPLLNAGDPGLNQPGALGNVGVGAPGVGKRDPGLNQPGARGNVGVGAPGVGVRDPGLNQPGAVGNTGPARRSVRR
jgi:hypothetical protein